MNTNEKRYLEQYAIELRQKIARINPYMKAFKTIAEIATSNKSKIDEDFEKNIDVKSRMEHTYKPIYKITTDIVEFIKKHKENREWIEEYTKQKFEDLIRVAQDSIKRFKDPVERHNYKWVCDKYIRLMQLILEESFSKVVYPQSYEKFNKEIKAKQAIYIKKKKEKRSFGIKDIALHCNGNNHDPWCCCGWGGPQNSSNDTHV